MACAGTSPRGGGQGPNRLYGASERHLGHLVFMYLELVGVARLKALDG